MADVAVYMSGPLAAITSCQGYHCNVAVYTAPPRPGLSWSEVQQL